jgi:ankyrin repeat protein
MAAASNDRHEIVALLLALDVDKDARDRDGMSALMFAASGGNLRSAALLIDKGADLEIRDKRTLTPLMGAALGGYSEVVQYLLEHGADADATGRGGVTARSLAEETKSSLVVRMLDEFAKRKAAGEVAPAAGEAKGPASSGKP